MLRRTIILLVLILRLWHVDLLLGNDCEIMNYSTGIGYVFVRKYQQRNDASYAFRTDGCASSNDREQRNRVFYAGRAEIM